MATEPDRRDAEEAPERQAERRAIRDRFRHRPGLAELLATGEISRDAYERAKALRDAGPPVDAAGEAGRGIAEWSAALRAERERQGLTIAEVADRSGVAVAVLVGLESGRYPSPPLRTLDRIAGALGKRVSLALVDAAASSNGA